MRSKGRIVFIVASCVSVMLVIIIGIMVFREARTLRKDGQTLDIRKEKLRMDQGLDPFPSTPNVLAISNNWVHLSKELQKLSRTMGKGQIVPDKRRSRVQWITLLAETQKQLRNLAATNSIVLPEGFAFGFELYDEGAPPASHNVPRLTQQILMVDALCRTLYDAGIEELKSIKRTEFEAAATGGTTWKGRRGLATVTNILAEVYTEECFSLEYDARESAFLKSLNGLASLRGRARRGPPPCDG